MIPFLLKEGADPTAMDTHGWQVRWAAMRGWGGQVRACVRWLVVRQAGCLVQRLHAGPGPVLSNACC